VHVLDLFSGIGGISLGLESVGYKTIGFCESDDYCSRVLRRHWRDVPIHPDVRELDGRQYKDTAQLVAGGFPCQPFSVAGQRGGSDDDRNLWPEMFRVIREVEPTWCLIENVPGIVWMELDRVLADLEDEGYACQAFDIPAAAVDANHIRARIWIVAYSDSNAIRQRPERPAEGWVEVCRRRHAELIDVGSDVADAEGERLEGGLSPGSQSAAGVRLLSDGRSEQSGGRHWAAEPELGRVAHGIPNRVDRMRGLGNSVVPAVVAELGEIILKADQELYLPW